MSRVASFARDSDRARIRPRTPRCYLTRDRHRGDVAAVAGKETEADLRQRVRRTGELTEQMQATPSSCDEARRRKAPRKNSAVFWTAFVDVFDGIHVTLHHFGLSRSATFPWDLDFAARLAGSRQESTVQIMSSSATTAAIHGTKMLPGVQCRTIFWTKQIGREPNDDADGDSTRTWF